MRIYRVTIDNQTPWRAFVGAFRLISFETTDRRVARRVVRLARRLGYLVKF